ncbi:MAG: hypothetical protein KAS32_20240 [Candidatus Peribacteraceae bacterium]|nr:hypothetical protein [Candidatus Peribacteraceae bacterium]
MIDTPEQLAYQYDDARFKVCAAGRRSSKTERAKRKVIREAFDDPGAYFFGAPTRDQVKKIYWKDTKRFIPKWAVKRYYDSDLIAELQNGSEIHLIGLDRPERFEGFPWKGGGIDEIADVKGEAIHTNILPALDTIGLNAWCMFYGVPDGLNHFFDLAEYARGQDDEWKFYSWKSSEILSDKAIAAAKARMDPKLYRQEYEASFEAATGRIYDDYSDANHTDMVFSPGVIKWVHDFNYLPMSSCIIQPKGKNDVVVDEIILDGASVAHAADEFIDRYGKHKRCPVEIYGDPSGRAGEKHGLISNYIELETRLRQAGFNFVKRKVFTKTKSIRDGQNALRSRILTADGKNHLFVNPEMAPTVDKGFKTVQLMKGSTYQENEKNRAQHVISAIRYFASFEYPITGKGQIRVKR